MFMSRPRSESGPILNWSSPDPNWPDQLAGGTGKIVLKMLFFVVTGQDVFLQYTNLILSYFDIKHQRLSVWAVIITTS